MEDLRFLLPVSGGKRSELDPIVDPSEAKNPERTDFRSFLTGSYSQTANRADDGLEADVKTLNTAAERERHTSEYNFSPTSTSQNLAIHARSEEIGRVIFTRDRGSEDKAHVDMESLNSGADALLSRVVGDASGSSKAMVDHIRETMLGATVIASSISKASSSGELNEDQLGFLTSSNANSWTEATQQMTPEPSRSLLGTAKLTNIEPQRFSAALDLNPAETGGAAKEQLAANIGQSVDLAKLVKPATMDFGTETGSSDHDSIQGGSNSSRGESGDQGGNQRDSEKQDADGRPSGSEKDRQNWRERFAELISDRIKVKVEEGEWLVRMSLQAAGLGSFDVSLKSNDTGVFGSIHTDDPQLKELLNSVLPELEGALNESLSSQGGQKVSLEVSDSNVLLEKGELSDSRDIVLTASDLSNSLPERFKAGDGLDVFV